MSKLVKIAVLLLLGLMAATQVRAQGTDFLSREFDARLLDTDEKRFLQAALAFEGFYTGLLDGLWGRSSQSALERYSRTRFGQDKPLQVTSAAVVLDSLDTFEKNGWQFRYIEWLETSLLFPALALRDGSGSDDFVNIEHVNSSLRYSLGRETTRDMIAVHDYVGGSAAPGSIAYTVRNEGLVVTSVRKSDGGTLYARSDRHGGFWSTILLSAAARDAGILAAVSGSIASESGRALVVPEKGMLRATVDLAFAAASQGDRTSEAASAPVAEPVPPGPAGDSTGTGFYVSPDGYVLTNDHVAGHCTTLTVNDRPATLVDASEDLDLAVLKVEGTAPAEVAHFAPAGAKLNSGVTVIGYPYGGLLGGLNATRGSVSSVKGLGGDVATMQVTAPVQPGNSGGPVVSDSGAVVGIVVSKLNARKVEEIFDDIPQNVNFAIRSEVAQLFLNANGIAPVMAEAAAPLAPEDLAAAVAAYTVLIRCGS